MATLDKKRKDKQGKEKKPKKKLKQLYDPKDLEKDLPALQQIAPPPPAVEADYDDELAEVITQHTVEPAPIFTGDRKP